MHGECPGGNSAERCQFIRTVTGGWRRLGFGWIEAESLVMATMVVTPEPGVASLVDIGVVAAWRRRVPARVSRVGVDQRDPE